MGCGSCGTGKPNGCKSNGGCSTGGCNRMNVHDWLQNLPFADPESSCKIIEVSFNNGSRKEFYRNPSFQYFDKGSYITVEGVGGFDVGEVSLSGELVRLQLKKHNIPENHPEIKKVLRKSTEKDIELYQLNKGRQKEALARSRAIARNLNLNMKLSEVDIQADGKKATFFYTAEDRVDFRELIKIFATDFKVKVEMRQIGIRQDAAKVGGIGSCGRELCCSTWLHDFKSVNTTAARYQNLSINQTKLSGQCGRLKCCLNYELDTYLDALQHFPDNADVLQLAKCQAFLVKKDIFKNIMWYTTQETGNKHFPVTIERVITIKKMNSRGERPEDLEPVEFVGGKIKEVEPQFVDVVGAISLRTLDKNQQKRNREDNDRRRNDFRPNTQDRRNEARPQPQPNKPIDTRAPKQPMDRNIQKQQPNRNSPTPPNNQRPPKPQQQQQSRPTIQKPNKPADDVA